MPSYWRFSGAWQAGWEKARRTQTVGTELPQLPRFCRAGWVVGIVCISLGLDAAGEQQVDGQQGGRNNSGQNGHGRQDEDRRRRLGRPGSRTAGLNQVG